ncbi:peptide chain release factor N(5)-glutamine methyltransferase [Arcanobacterium canis]|uniref:peptide chain release factor N(5)-glutamine methyltransferase n=1 Tax=Arcanobacterium canis TaxID=999183 RepID=A0ABY8FX04_9ACTO|nr:peptide chain release factor N(5)-glutamine methyltransferase [Arcanobacterium canis]WFM83046.1 peptide chain release factor N(5)-glutamine methyltransferase [Arcanobacterium canis]
MNWAHLVRQAEGILADAGVPAGPDARLIAEEVSGRKLALVADQEPTSAEHQHYDDLIFRRATREPLQHVLGKMWFRYLELVSRPGTFIVRPETEMVVQAGLDAIAYLRAPRVVDLCTGSGAIALSIATERPTSAVWAIEKSEDAFAVAQQNNSAYGNRVTMIHGDALEASSLLGDVLYEGPFDLVISNPPYVPLGHQLDAEAQADPAMALWGGGEEGLDFPYAVIGVASELLGEGGILVMEHASEQSLALVSAAEHAGFHAHTGQDLTGRDRFLFATKKEK